MEEPIELYGQLIKGEWSYRRGEPNDKSTVRLYIKATELLHRVNGQIQSLRLSDPKAKKLEDRNSILVQCVAKVAASLEVEGKITFLSVDGCDLSINPEEDQTFVTLSMDQIGLQLRGTGKPKMVMGRPLHKARAARVIKSEIVLLHPDAEPNPRVLGVPASAAPVAPVVLPKTAELLTRVSGESAPAVNSEKVTAH